MNAIKATFLSLFLSSPEEPRRRDRCIVRSPKKSSGQWFRSTFAAGKFDKQIHQAELDYANGKALDRLY